MVFIFILLFGLSIVSLLVLPWWSILIIAFAMALLLKSKIKHPFWLGFIPVFSAWVFLCLWKSILNQNLLAARIAKLFHLPHWSILILITGIIGGLLGGLGVYTGYWLRKDLKFFGLGRPL